MHLEPCPHKTGLAPSVLSTLLTLANGNLGEALRFAEQYKRNSLTAQRAQIEAKAREATAKLELAKRARSA